MWLDILFILLNIYFGSNKMGRLPICCRSLSVMARRYHSTKTRLLWLLKKLNIVVLGCTKRAWHSVLQMKLRNMLLSFKKTWQFMLLKIKCIISWLSIIILQRHVPMKVTKLFKLLNAVKIQLMMMWLVY